ncbi:type IV-A pilus assembly ATPase PilB [Leucothrix pacifica]|uniref:Type IV-A pilus assembly ATPase PilB n=1 Tax=Leucothrix pacifica TaxID=1247513 RepID=A0A317CUV2_9GAMM|nr:type IV-A pilus assembly ATPase PilB [Leucothrix pacifica]PWR00103.1 type IV-A pilus assembly ATPase PilB [Leucothrix pacifica]
MTTSTESTLPAIVQTFVNNGKLDGDTAARAVRDASDRKKPIVTHLLDRQIVDSIELATACSNQYGLSFVDLDAITIAPEMQDLIPDDMMKRLMAVPLFTIGGALIVAIADPHYSFELGDIKVTTKLVPEPVIVEHNKLRKLIFGSDSGEDMAAGLSITSQAHSQDLVVGTSTLQKKDEEDDDEGTDVTKFVNELLSHAIKKGVSDIHIEPYEKILRVRYRIDGILQVVSMPPKGIARKMTSRIKVMAELNSSERRIPQDGRIHFQVGEDKFIDFRVNTLPTLYGEKIVMRILDSDTASLGIDNLGFDDKQKADLMAAIAKPDGMMLVTGPTGSGKTVTLYACLNLLNTSEKNISTAEDPAEIQVPGINQVNVNDKVGLTFSSALRAFLRQDPDIIMVGEIRDLETAEISVKAAQTGHLVLSTLHTNSAPETLTRLLNMGIPPFNIASTVHLIVAQRLARRLCKSCKQPADIPADVLTQIGFSPDELDDLTIYEANGCGECSGGYKGRVGIYQVMPISANMEKLVMENGNALELAELAQSENINDLRQSALDKVRQGITTLAEVERVTKD